ncbi:SET domain-containing protein SmydA-8-like isoform X2 [Contarinia nasturtii]|uniref:SET domain-containing protein SmydA-8-like isoform X2 n=1 Tax=Contarinia nasturtii TaxID=265458 RepID=UPI0012D4BF56|nr:SET domain-containing protein SmydA-8-like isoform X2 [Contarinia nasturtii]
MVDRQNRINDLNECIKNHVGNMNSWSNSCQLRPSNDFGCGVFAIRDIKPNELLFEDKPLMLGPTGNKYEPIVCVICYEKIENDVHLNLCPRQCGLILCRGKSVCAEQHLAECELLQKWKPKNPNELSFKKLRAVNVIRSLFLSEKEKNFLELMQKNFVSLENEIFFNDEFENFPEDKETLVALRSASAAINTNAFKVLYRCGDDDDENLTDGRDVSVTGFYPVKSLINHKCSPNTRHDIDKHFVGRVLASRPIKKDEQIFISYSQLLWGTNSRRMHMIVSKQFRCECERCIDPTENSTNLSAIQCADKNCTAGLVLPIEPLDFRSPAKCNCCGKICENRRFLQTHELAATITRNFTSTKFTLAELEQFFEARLYKLVPECSQFVVECKLKAAKHMPSNCQDLYKIKSYCEDILRILNRLNVGECSLKGFLAHKLYTVRKKLKNFSEILQNDSDNSQISSIDFLLNDDEELWKTANVILKNVSAAPRDIFEN